MRELRQAGRWVVPLLVVVLLAVLTPERAGADGAWLDGPPTAWNQPGMSVPAAPPGSGTPAEGPGCRERVRAPETIEDVQVTAAGWLLSSSYQGGWGVRIVEGNVAFDGMCRPIGYQAFVFYYGAFAGTLSPTPMDARTDGALTSAFLSGPSPNGGVSLSAVFARYGREDPLCCPSRSSSLSYRLALEGGRPVVAPTGRAITQNATGD